MDGKQITYDQMEQACDLLYKCLERIDEINKGTYDKRNPPIQFDYCTSSKLSNLADKIEDVSKRINRIVYQEK